MKRKAQIFKHTRMGIVERNSFIWVACAVGRPGEAGSQLNIQFLNNAEKCVLATAAFRAASRIYEFSEACVCMCACVCMNFVRRIRKKPNKFFSPTCARTPSPFSRFLFPKLHKVTQQTLLLYY